MADMPSGPSAAVLHRRLQQLRAGFRTRLAEMLETIRGEADSIVRAEVWNEVAAARVDTLAGIVHRVVGSAGTFGYPQVSEAAAPLELLLRGLVATREGPNAERRAQLASYLAHLQRAWRESDARGDAAAEPKAPPLPLQPNYRILVLDQGGSLAGEIERHIAIFGYEVVAVAHLDEAEAELDRAPPAAVVIDFDRIAGDRELVGLPVRRGLKIPFLAVSARDDFDTRLQAAQAGCSAYLTLPLNTDELADWLDRLAGGPAASPYRVLIVDDDRYLAESYSLALTLAGMQPTVLTDPRGIMAVLGDMTPDLILMDFYMPGCNGIDLARVIRQQQRHLSIPIVFLSVETDHERQLSARSYGGDDFLSKPIEIDRLVASVRLRARRARALRTVMESDSLTGLLNHVRTKERIAAELSRAIRHDLALTVALIDLDRFKLVNDTHGHLAGDRVIKALARMLTHRLRRSDVIGRYGGEEFAVILPETPLADAARVIDDLRVRFAVIPQRGETGEFRVTFSAGLAARGPDTPEEADTIIAIADAALYRAKEAGRNRIEAAAPPPAPEQPA